MDKQQIAKRFQELLIVVFIAVLVITAGICEKKSVQLRYNPKVK